jgi:hypothetical protein
MQRVLPTLDNLIFYKQDEMQYYDVCLQMGTYGDKTGTGSSLYIYLRKGANRKSAPGMHLVRALPTIEISTSYVKSGNANTGTAMPDFSELTSMVEKKTARLFWSFRALNGRVVEIKAVAKYCFMLAARSGIHGYTEHRIPQKVSFEKGLRSACEHMAQYMENNPKYSAETGHYGKMARNALAGMHPRSLKTNTSDDAAEHAEKTGLNDLESLPPEVLQKLEGLDDEQGEHPTPPAKPCRSRFSIQEQIKATKGTSRVNTICDRGESMYCLTRRNIPSADNIRNRPLTNIATPTL